MGYRVVEVVATPNPNARKFILDHPISDGPLSFFTASAAATHEVASSLFAIEGVTNLLLLGDFITVSKRPELRWDAIVTAVRKTLKNS